MFGISRKQMIWLCHSMATMLDAGLPVTRVLAVLGGQARGGRMRRALRQAGARLAEGDTLSEAFEASGGFPPLFLRLVSVGEASGTLDRTIRESGRFYEFQQGLLRAFLSRITLPVIQYLAAVAIVAVASYILQMVGGGESGGPMGPPGTVLLLGYGLPAALVVAYVLVLPLLGGTWVVHYVLFYLPVAGRVVRTLGTARFSLVMHLMMEAGAPMQRSLESAFGATGNAVFVARGRRAVQEIKQGATMSAALAATGLFPVDYLEMLQVGEESGKLSEQFNRLSAECAERAEFALNLLARAAAAAVWLAVVGVMIWFIVSTFVNLYLGPLQRHLDMPLGR